MADAAVTAAQAQHTAVAGESTASAVVNTLARSVLALDEEITAVDARIAARFREHGDAEVILSMPGMEPLLGAEFVACTGGDMDALQKCGLVSQPLRQTPPTEPGNVLHRDGGLLGEPPDAAGEGSIRGLGADRRGGAPSLCEGVLVGLRLGAIVEVWGRP
ncbi:hypothetical protein ACWGDE_04090 [Streptomyces sp. NPDC054956]